MIKLTSNGKEVNFKTTVFPDGTSQVWKLDDLNIEAPHVTFVWENNEAEIFHLLQLVDLIGEYSKEKIILHIPYLPYARQDKLIDSASTFALRTFIDLLNTKRFSYVELFDVHSDIAFQIEDSYEKDVLAFHRHVYADYKQDVTFFPDKGAFNRYYGGGKDSLCLFGEKTRDQSTGAITGYKLHNTEYYNLEDRKILIVDDICDGGATFITAARELRKFNPKDIALCVSHGVFSRGFEEMKAEGICKFFYTNSILKNTDGYKVWE